MTITDRCTVVAGAFTATLLASAAHAATLRAAPATVTAVVKSAQPGDVVQLSSGAYVLDLWGIRKASPGVTITPAPGATVTASEINPSGSSWLTFSGITVAMTPATQYGIYVENGSTNIVFDGLAIHQADKATLAGVGVFFRNIGAASNIVLKNSEISWVGSGINAANVDGVTLTNNKLHDIQTDGILALGMMHSTISYNFITNFHNANGGHPDGIQWATDTNDKPPKIPTSSLTIDHNRIEIGSGDQFQGIFGEDGDHITITNNIVMGSMGNGIADARSSDVTIDHNFVQSYAAPAIQTNLVVRQQADRISITNNTAPAIAVGSTADGTVQPTNVTQARNTKTTPARSPTDYTQVNAWLAATSSPAAR